MLNRRVEAVAPAIALIERAPALFDLVGGSKDLRARFESVWAVFAGLVAIDLGGDDNVTNGNILHTTGYAHKKRHTRIEMPDCTLGHCRS